MWPFGWFRNLFQRKQPRPLDEGVTEKAFGVTPVTSRLMKSNIELWWALYTDAPPWETDCVKSIGLPSAIGRELAWFAMSEFSVSVSGGPRGEYLNKRLQAISGKFCDDLETGLCLGYVAFRPYMERGQLIIDCSGPTAFTPVAFDGDGNAISGVFEVHGKQGKETYTRLEYHGFEYNDDGSSVYVVRNKAYKGDAGSGVEVNLDVVDEWRDILPEQRIANLEKPLFAYFANPSSNNIEPGSKVGVSVYGGEPNTVLLQQADEQWERLLWEFKSGERKIFTDGKKVGAGQFIDRLFQRGDFTAEGNLFEQFSPEFRNDPLYKGFQQILQRLELNVGLSFGTLSDQQNTVQLTATAILAAKNRQRITVHAIQNAMEQTIDGLLYAMNAYCDLWHLAPSGEYEAAYNWGDGVMDDPDTIRQDKAMMLQEISAGITNPWEYRVAFKKESMEEAKANLPGMEDMADQTPQQEVE